jgi:hypothetical protein
MHTLHRVGQQCCLAIDRWDPLYFSYGGIVEYTSNRVFNWGVSKSGCLGNKHGRSLSPTTLFPLPKWVGSRPHNYRLFPYPAYTDDNSRTES